MKTVRLSIASIALLVIFLELGVLKPAHAYIDPGTGSYIFSVLIALVCGAGYALKTFWGRIITFFHGMTKKRGE